MNQIKFRVWAFEQKKYLPPCNFMISGEGELFYVDKREEGFAEPHPLSSCHYVSCNTRKVMENTDFDVEMATEKYDLMDREIFKGDIVEVNIMSSDGEKKQLPSLFKVVWCGSEFLIQCSRGFKALLSEKYDYKIIGNEKQNPDMLNYE